MVKGADLDLLNEVRQIGVRVQRIRGESFERPPIAVRVGDSIRQVLGEARVAAALGGERLAARGRSWADVGLGDAESPRRLLLALAADLAGVGLDQAGNRLLVAPDRFTASDFRPTQEDPASSTILLATGVRPDEPLAAHILMHVRQRERSADEPLAETTDRMLARMAWAEGEATLVALRYLFEGLGVADEVVVASLDPGDVLGGALLPTGLDGLSSVERQLVDLVYLEGFEQAVGAFAAGGWQALDRAMAARQTTRALRHADTARARRPVPAGVEDASFARAGLERVDRDVLGQFAIAVLVSDLTGKDNLGLIAADGWVGDHLDRWESPGSTDGVTDWRTEWESERAATVFHDALLRGLGSRAPGVEPAVSEGETVLRAEGRVVRVRLSGTGVHVRIAAGAVDRRLEQPSRLD